MGCADDEFSSDCRYKAVVVVRQMQPFQFFAIETGHITFSGHIDIVADACCTRRIEVAFDRTMLLNIGAVGLHGKDATVQRTAYHSSVRSYCHRLNNIVFVGQLVVDEVHIEELINALVGSHPQLVPAVYEETLDEIETSSQLSHRLSVVTIDGVGVGDEQLTLLGTAHVESIVGCFKVEGLQHR